MEELSSPGIVVWLFVVEHARSDIHITILLDAKIVGTLPAKFAMKVCKDVLLIVLISNGIPNLLHLLFS